MSKRFLMQPLALSVLLAASSASHAALSYFTTQAGFVIDLNAVGIDDFRNLSVYVETPSPMIRAAGPYSYSARASTMTFFGAGVASNPSLSTNIAEDSITFSSFSPSFSAIGGNFFGSDINGRFLSGNVTLLATDSLGATSSQTIAGATAGSFAGFKSTGTIVSLVVSAVQTASPLWPTVDNLTLGRVAAVPEPGTYAMLLAGLGVVGLMARHRRA
jgi:hypothetical protein